MNGLKEDMAGKKGTLGSTLAALQKAETQVEQLRRQAASERAEHLEGLHVSFGFTSRSELIEALAELDGARRRDSAEAGSNNPEAPGTKSKRPRLTPEAKAEIVQAVKDGESGVSIARRYCISGQTVQNIKRAAGLVRTRKKRK